jgi:hypothetical protein
VRHRSSAPAIRHGTPHLAERRRINIATRARSCVRCNVARSRMAVRCGARRRRPSRRVVSLRLCLLGSSGANASFVPVCPTRSSQRPWCARLRPCEASARQCRCPQCLLNPPPPSASGASRLSRRLAPVVSTHAHARMKMLEVDTQSWTPVRPSSQHKSHWTHRLQRC